jgi:hypothetical protein
MGGRDKVLEFIKGGEGKERDMKPLLLKSFVSGQNFSRGH